MSMHTILRSSRGLFIGLLMAGMISLPAGAEDIHLFSGVAPSAMDVPNVIILLDNTANWSSAFNDEKAALQSLVNGLNTYVNVGLMMFTESGGSNGSPAGAYTRFGVRNMDATNKAALVNLTNALHVNNDKSSGGKLGLSMVEVYRYLKGIGAYAGHNKVKRDYAGNAADNPFAAGLPGNAFTSAASSTYVSPITGECSKTFLIYISNGPVGDNSSDTSTATAELSAAGGDTTTISLSPSGSQSNIGDEWARFMANTDLSGLSGTQKLVTYTIDVLPSTTGQGPGWTRLLKSMAQQGDGGYFNASSSTEILGILQSIFSEIKADNSVFASASLPVSASTQSTYLNQIFIGMFRPDTNSKPRWLGNLKQYKFAATLVGTEYQLSMVDATGASAISSTTGFITPCAVSFWTPSAADTYWSNDPIGNCSTGAGAAVNNASNSPDGEMVEKGGAAYKLRDAISFTATGNWNARNIKTCTTASPAACTALGDFITTNAALTAAALGVASSTDKDDLINWIRGKDYLTGSSAENDGNVNGSTTDTRPNVHGDVLHSRPLSIDFGTAGSPNVKVFYGGNDGMLHAINANQVSSEGTEMWSFVAPEHWGKLKRIRDNSPLIDFPSLPVGVTPTPEPKSYFFDGPIGHYQSGGTVWIYPTMRRGGRTLYAFDVSTPATPVLKWKRGCPNLGDDTGCDAGWGAIGQTWSEPKATVVTGYASGPVLMFGGGYDACEDAQTPACGAAKGKRVYVLDAGSGALLKELTTDYSVAADIKLVDSDFDGKADLAYAVDTGGNVYRVNMGSSAPGSFTITKIASLGCATPATSCANRRKFLFAPEVVVTDQYIAVLVGSGDREHPLSTDSATGVDNGFFVLKDKPADATWLSSGSCGASVLCLGELLAVDPDAAAPTQAALDAKKGWYLSYGTGTHDKEQVVTSAVVVGGIAYYSTHTPEAPTTCGQNLGLARGYAVNFLTAAPVDGETLYDNFTGGGLPPSPVTGMVEVDNPSGTGTIILPFLVGGKNTSGSVCQGALCGQNPKLNISGTRTRSYWFMEK